MYRIIPQQIPHDRRAEINEKILYCIGAGKNELPPETIYNCYTDIEGLHNLKQKDFANYHTYSQAKKEFEMGQFYFRFIRLDSKEQTRVHFVTCEDSIEQNLMALVLTKERLNEFIKTGEVKEQSEIFEEFDISMSVIESLLTREQDSKGKSHISWGRQKLTGSIS